VLVARSAALLSTANFANLGPHAREGAVNLEVCDVLIDAFSRIHEEVDAVLRGLDDEQLSFRADREANSIAWLVWHLTRIMDDHLAAAGGCEQVWAAGWSERFALPFAESATGYGQRPDEVGEVRPSVALLLDYFDEVHTRAMEFVGGLSDAQLDQVVDRSWSPPVTLGVRLVSVWGDSMQHAGQAALIRGIVLRRRAEPMED